MEYGEWLLRQKKQIRMEALDLAIESGNGHLASAFSIVEILIALEETLKERDRFILSKGHGCLSFYVWLRRRGFNPTISGHPDIQTSEGIECTTGSLGHGLPIGVGMAFAKKLKAEEGNIYVLMGDGEMQEGTTWESLLLASHHKLDNLTVIVDCNGLQSLGKTDDILSLGNLPDKLTAFGCFVVEADGHNVEDIGLALRYITLKPKVIIAHTTKGKGISFMEDNPVWHNRLPEGEQLVKAYKELA